MKDTQRTHINALTDVAAEHKCSKQHDRDQNNVSKRQPQAQADAHLLAAQRGEGRSLATG
jgi:hypothetical protein